MNPIYVIREREWGAFWCPINGKWNWTDNVRAAKTFSSNEEAAEAFRRFNLDPEHDMISLIALRYGEYGDYRTKRYIFRHDVHSFHDLTSVEAFRKIESIGGKIFKRNRSCWHIYMPECTIAINNDGGSMYIQGITEEEFDRLYIKITGNDHE